MTATPFPPRLYFLVFLVALSTSTALFIHRVETGGDNLDYIMQARSVQHGQWNEALRWYRPVGYSACVAAALNLAGITLRPGVFSVEPRAYYLIQAINVLVFALSAVAILAWARRVCRNGMVATGVALLFATNQTLAAWSSVVGAEPLLILLTFAALTVWEGAPHERQIPVAAGIAFALLTGMAIFIKSQALALAAALFVWTAIRRKFTPAHLAAVMLVGALTIGAVVLMWFCSRFYLSHFAAKIPYGFTRALSWGERMRQVLAVYSWGWANVQFPKILGDRGILELAGMTGLARPFDVTVLALMVLGLVRSLRRDLRLSHLYLLCACAMLAMWPAYLERYLFPLVPLGLWMTLEGAGAIGEGIDHLLRKERLWAARLVVVLVVPVFVWNCGTNVFAGAKNWRNIATLSAEPPWAPERYRISREDDFADYITAGIWLGTNTPGDSIIFCRKALFIELVSGRRSRYYSGYSTSDELWNAIREEAGKSPCFVLRDNFSPDSVYGMIRELRLMPVINRYRDRMELIHRTEGGSEIYRVLLPVSG